MGRKRKGSSDTSPGLSSRKKSQPGFEKMLPPRIKQAITDNPKKPANLIDLVNLATPLREFMGQSQTSRLGCFMHVWSYVKENEHQVYYPSCFHVTGRLILNFGVT